MGHRRRPINQEPLRKRIFDDEPGFSPGGGGPGGSGPGFDEPFAGIGDGEDHMFEREDDFGGARRRRTFGGMEDINGNFGAMGDGMRNFDDIGGTNRFPPAVRSRNPVRRETEGGGRRRERPRPNRETRQPHGRRQPFDFGEDRDLFMSDARAPSGIEEDGGPWVDCKQRDPLDATITLTKISIELIRTSTTIASKRTSRYGFARETFGHAAFGRVCAVISSEARSTTATATTTTKAAFWNAESSTAMGTNRTDSWGTWSEFAASSCRCNVKTVSWTRKGCAAVVVAR